MPEKYGLTRHVVNTPTGRALAVNRRPAKALAALLAFCLLNLPSAFGEADVTEPLDPLLGDVVRMLEVGIDSDLIVRWIETGGRRPAPLGADDLIALNRAGASKQLMEYLLEMAAVAPPLPPDVTDDTADDSTAMVGRPAEAPLSIPEPVAETNAQTIPRVEDCCLVGFSVEYRAAEDKEGEETVQPGRDLFLYVDGQYLARFESQGSIASRGPVQFKAMLTAGEHVLRLTRELHTRAKGHDKAEVWAHETTISPSVIKLGVAPGFDWQLELSWVQSEFSTRRPLSWRWYQNGAEVAGAEKAGEFRERWPFLCEDAEISGASGAIAGWRMRDRLKSCLKWASLWPGQAATSRADMLEDLRRLNFKPVVGGRARIN